MKLTNNQKDWAWSLIIIGALSLYVVKCTTPAQAERTTHYYEVKVRYQLGGCYGYKTVTVPADDSFDARPRAERVVQYQLEVSAQSVREIR